MKESSEWTMLIHLRLRHKPMRSQPAKPKSSICQHLESVSTEAKVCKLAIQRVEAWRHTIDITTRLAFCYGQMSLNIWTFDRYPSQFDSSPCQFHMPLCQCDKDVCQFDSCLCRFDRCPQTPHTNTSTSTTHRWNTQTHTRAHTGHSHDFYLL